MSCSAGRRGLNLQFVTHLRGRSVGHLAGTQLQPCPSVRYLGAPDIREKRGAKGSARSFPSANRGVGARRECKNRGVSTSIRDEPNPAPANAFTQGVFNVKPF